MVVAPTNEKRVVDAAQFCTPAPPHPHHPCPSCAVWLTFAPFGEQVRFLLAEIVDGEYVREMLAPIQALGHGEAVWVHWSEDASALTPLVRA